MSNRVTSAGKDDPFRPRPGRIRSRGDGQAGSHVNRVLREIARLRPERFGAAAKVHFTGRRGPDRRRPRSPPANRPSLS